MISCTVGSRLAPEVTLTCADKEIVFVIDTGFNGDIELMIREDEMPPEAEWFGNGVGRDFKGTAENYEVFLIPVRWGQSVKQCLGYRIHLPKEPKQRESVRNLLGTKMLDNCRLCLDFVEGGAGLIHSL